MGIELTIYDLREIQARSHNKITAGRRIPGHGAVVREYKTVKPSRRMCGGCRDDYYNHGNNAFGGDGCWSFKDAKVVDKVGHSSIHVCGGVDTIKKRTLSCWSAVSK